MKRYTIITIAISLICFVANAQEQKVNKDFYQQIATQRAKTNPRVHTLVPSPPAVLADIELESVKNNKKARIGNWNPLDTRAEFNEELARLREESKT